MASLAGAHICSAGGRSVRVNRKSIWVGAFLGLAAGVPGFAADDAAQVDAFPGIAAGGGVQGDPAKGAVIVAKVCLACHGTDGNSQVPIFPKLAGQWPEYIVKQLQDIRNKKRQADPMVQVIAELSPEDYPHVAVYFRGQKSAPGVVKEPTLVEAGKKLYDDGNPGNGVPACAGCHGADGKGTDRFPVLSGQHSDYVVGQLKLFSAGERKNDKRLMRTVADRLTDEEIKAVAEYIASMP
jgi:cytochrome c553